jgi:transcriptional regulator with XRE-family HTH domain
MPAAPVALSQARIEAGLSQTELAAEIGVPRGTLYNWERNRCGISDRAVLRRLSQVLNVPQRAIILG